MTAMQYGAVAGAILALWGLGALTLAATLGRIVRNRETQNPHDPQRFDISTDHPTEGPR